MSLSERERTEILGAIRKHVLKNHINVGGVSYDAWIKLMEERTPTLLAGGHRSLRNGCTAASPGTGRQPHRFLSRERKPISAAAHDQRQCSFIRVLGQRSMDLPGCI